MVKKRRGLRGAWSYQEQGEKRQKEERNEEKIIIHCAIEFLA